MHTEALFFGLKIWLIFGRDVWTETETGWTHLARQAGERIFPRVPS